LLGGRAAEVLILHETTTGAGDDLQRTTDLARRMVTKWGMSEVLGPLTYGDEQEPVFLGREIAQHRDYSEDTARLIDKEVKDIVAAAFDRAITILRDNQDTLHRLAEALLDREILDSEEIQRILDGHELRPLDVEASAVTEVEKPSAVEPEEDAQTTVEEPGTGDELPAPAGESRPAAAESARAREETPLISDT
jgi:cell division protease FtsH